MMKNQMEEDNFTFTYSAKEQEEVKKIRQKYQPQEEDKMTRLRRLDANVTKKATIVSISTGIIGVLVLGTGMSLIMTNLGELLGMEGFIGMMIGSMIGMVGIILICCAYPLYNCIIRKERKKIAPEVLRLTEELMK